MILELSQPLRPSAAADYNLTNSTKDAKDAKDSPDLSEAQTCFMMSEPFPSFHLR